MAVGRRPSANFPPQIKRGGLYENAKPQQALYSQNPAVRYDHRIERPGTTRPEFERFIRSIHPQLRNPLPTGICL